MALQVGQIVDAIVKSVQTFGLFCVDETDTEMLVLIPDTSWIASYCSCVQFADVGDRITIKILNINNASKKIAASVRHLYPDPWATDALQVGRKYAAKVVRNLKSADRCGNGPGYLLELLPGAFVTLCTSDVDLVAGDWCDVTITHSNPDARAVRISVVNTEGGEQ